MEQSDPEMKSTLDGGWGWMIVASSFMCNLIGDGIVYSFGILMPTLVNHFNQGKGAVASIGSLLRVKALIGPIASAIVNRFGCRVTCVLGSLVAAFGLALSSFSSSLEMMMITFGVIGGIGFGLIYVPAVVCVGQYFEKKRALAVGIVMSGSGVGFFGMGPIIKALLDIYDWRGTIFVMSAITFNCSVFGALMRPLMKPSSSARNLPDSRKTMERKDESKTNSDVVSDQRKCFAYFSPLKNPIFFLFSAGHLMGFFGYVVPFIYIIDVALSKDIDSQAAYFLVSIIGITNVIGRIFFGYISDFSFVDPIMIIYVAAVVSGGATVSIPYCSSYVEFVTAAASYGLFASPFISLASVVLVDLLGVSQLVNAFGLLCLVDGIAFILGPPLAGLLFDWTNSYEGPFLFAGAAMFASSFFFVCTSFTWRYRQQKGENTYL